MNELVGSGMELHIPCLVAFAGNVEIRDAAPRIPESLTLSLQSSSRRSAWKIKVDRMARSRFSFMVASLAAADGALLLASVPAKLSLGVAKA